MMWFFLWFLGSATSAATSPTTTASSPTSTTESTSFQLWYHDGSVPWNQLWRFIALRTFVKLRLGQSFSLIMKQKKIPNKLSCVSFIQLEYVVWPKPELKTKQLIYIQNLWNYRGRRKKKKVFWCDAEKYFRRKQKKYYYVKISLTSNQLDADEFYHCKTVHFCVPKDSENNEAKLHTL